MSTRIRILIVDDYSIIRETFRLYFGSQPDMEVIATASDGEEAIRLTEELLPDVVLIDAKMPGISGYPASSQIMSRHPEVKIVVMTGYDDEDCCRLFAKLGVQGYVLKIAEVEEFLQAIRTAYRGGTWYDPRMRRFFEEGSPAPPPGDGEASSVLTDRELEILRFVVRGHSHKEIAARMFISVKTVETHRDRLMKKLNLRDRAELVRYALDHKLLQ